MENEFLRVEFQPCGTLNLLDKTTGRAYRGLHYFVDGADTGQGWESRPAGEDQLISSLGAPVEIALVENTHLSASVRVRYAMRVPSGLIHGDSHHETKRGEIVEDLPIESIFTLRAGARRLEVKTVIENKARNHRLRVFFPTDLTSAKTSAAETPFDVVERPIVRDEKHPYSQTANPVYPCLRFADISDGKCGLALLTQGIHEYEATDDPARAIAATLLRAFETTLCTVSYRWERRPDQELSQVPGRVTARYALFPHAGNWEQGGVMREAEDFCLPLIGVQTGRGEVGGRGEGGVSGEGVVSGDGGEGGGRGKSGAHSEGGAPQDASLLEIQPESLVLSALKKAEDRDTLILRLYNPESRPAKGVIRFAKPIASARLLDMNEDSLPSSLAPSLPSSLADAPALKPSSGALRLNVPPKKVITLEVLF